MCGIRVSVENGKANLFTPYNAEFVREIKTIGGARWNSSSKCWTVPEECLDRAREIMVDIYGYADDEPAETVTVKLTCIGWYSELREGVTVLGKTIAQAWGRDSGAKVGDDVILLNGTIASGGSAKNWTTNVSEGAEFKLLNVSKSLFEKWSDTDSFKAEIISTKVDKDKLIEEREKLLARLAEIDKILEEV